MGLEEMEIPHEVRGRVLAWRAEGLSVGLVPTMGALHEGHLSLVRASVAQCERTVVSVFVNPTQFPEGEDLQRYPRRPQEDAEKLRAAGADLIFRPGEEVMYCEDACTSVVQEGLPEMLCGAHRPGHFRGVLTVVAKLFNIACPDRAYFGRKDFQQSVLICRMVRDLNFAVEVRVMPTVREHDGLAMSSRNEYLSPAQRRQAVCLFEALRLGRRLFNEGEVDPEPVKEAMRELIERHPEAEPQYVEIVRPDDLRAVERITRESVACLAVFVGEARLIDNMPFGPVDDIFVEPPPERAEITG